MEKGELPEGWEWTKLRDISERIHYGYTASAENKKVGPKLLRITDIQDNKVDWATVPYCPISEEDLPNYLLKSGDLVFARTGATVGKSFLIDGDIPESVFASYLIRVILKKTVDPNFIYCFFQSPHYWNQIEKQKVGAGQENVNSQKLSQIEIPLPPLPVQRQIVAVLEQAEALKRQRQEADTLTGALLKSVFYEMFGDPVRNEKGWNIVSLNEICDEMTVGVVVKPASYYVENGIPALRSLNIRQDQLDLTNLVYFSSSDNDTTLAKSKIRKGDVLVVRTGYPGTACVVPSDLDGANCIDLIILRPEKKTVNCDYLSRFLNSEYGKAQALAGNTGLAQQHLNVGAIRQVKIPLPPLALQQQFARIVEEVERIRERQAASGKEIEELCGGLVQRAFAGELIS